MIETIENTIIKNLISNEEYMRKVLPFLKPDYFDNTHEKIIFDEVTKFIVAYDKSPTSEILSIECEKRKDINDDSYKDILTYLKDLETFFKEAVLKMVFAFEERANLLYK